MQNSLTTLRKERGMTQADLGTLAGVSRQTIVSIEKGHFDPSLPLAFRLAEIFECRIEDIFTPD
ncbi:transcriptional regulator [Bowdeniella nasicola]|uniref:Transcriptional regulator n=1 Tax=Bowdeniella nasicola TaxID=208480 RepID=A0A1Q5Q406_9ACTO|nr:helix-turn-helix transcriptional regulator [Bowdeniella nasicola]OKL54554.1 transcriptional regulator [Bowdeniella nasicola]